MNSKLLKFTNSNFKSNQQPLILLKNSISLNHHSEIINNLRYCLSHKITIPENDLNSIFSTCNHSWPFAFSPSEINILSQSLSNHSLILFLGKYSNLHSAYSVTRKSFNINSLSAFINVLCSPQYNAFESAFNIYNKLLLANIPPTKQILLDLISCAAKNQSFMKHALDLYSIVESGSLGFSIDKDFVFALANGYSINGDIVSTRAILEKHKYIPDHHSFLLMIQTHCARGNVADAEQIYSDLIKSNFKVSTDVLEILINAYAKTNSVSGAIRHFHNGDIFNLEPTLEMCNGVMRAHLNVKEPLLAWKRAKKTIEISQKKSKTNWIPDCIIQPLAYNSQNKHLDYLKDNLRFSEFSDKSISNIIGRILCQVTDKSPTFGIKLYQEFNNGDYKHLELPRQGIAWATACFAQSDLKKARDMFEINREDMGKMVKYAYPYLIEGYLKTKDVESAMNLYNEAAKNGNIGIKSLEKVMQYESNLPMDIIEKVMNDYEEMGFVACKQSEPILYKKTGGELSFK